MNAQKALLDTCRGRPDLAAKLARTLNNLAILLAEAGRPDEAAATFRESIDLQLKRSAEAPTLPGPRWQAARAKNNLGVLLLKVRPPEAWDLFQQSRQTLETLRAEFPGIVQYRQELASVYHNLALLEEIARRRPEAERCRRLALDLLTQLATESSTTPDFRQRAAVSSLEFHLLADIDPSAARKAADEAIRVQEAIVADYSDIPQYLDDLGNSLYRLAVWQLDRKDWEGAERTMVKAVNSHDAAFRAVVGNRTYGAHLGDSLGLLSRTLIERNDPDGGATVAERIPEVLPDDLAAHLNAAALLIRCAGKLQGGAYASESLSPSAGFEAKAVQILARAVERGLIQGPNPLDRPEFRTLQARPDYQRLLKRVNERTTTRNV